MPNSPFRYYLRVRYAECDGQKIVFNARYGEYVELGTTEYLRALGFGEELIAGELDYQLVKQTIEWKASARFDNVMEITINTARVGTTSFEIFHEFRIAGAVPIIATAQTVYVCIDAQTLEKMPVSDALRKSLDSGAPGSVTDHAGFLIV
ncbi:MAG: thioesterase family protein [Candidatus Hydrogenedentes bacterium]|nr:thioesterase family protein [Candidatus Hydrogenedentota bacterium]